MTTTTAIPGRLGSGVFFRRLGPEPPGSQRKPLAVLRAIALLAPLLVLLGTSGCMSSGPKPIAVHPGYSQGQTEAGSRQGEKLTLVTYNIWGLPPWINFASSRRYLRIARELERLNADLVLLQEVWTKKALEAVPADGKWAVAAARPVCFFRRNGLVVLSRFPILSGEFHPFSAAALPDALVTKGALKVTIELADKRRLNIWNVHLQDGHSYKTRTRQITELLGWIRAAADGQFADLIGGDFNCTPDSAQYRQLSRALGPEVQELKSPEHFITYDGLSANPRRARTLDYVFIRCGPQVGEISASPSAAFTASRRRQRLSDHLGIEVLLSLGLAPSDLTQRPFGSFAKSQAALPQPSGSANRN
jgi:endonuclease/exonuclease/phosphatase family metal-dependent hydrolase